MNTNYEEYKQTPSDLIEGDCLIMGKFISPEIDHNIKAPKLNSMGKVKEKLGEVEGFLWNNWQDKYQFIIDECPIIVSQTVSNCNTEDLLLDAGSGYEDEYGQIWSEVSGENLLHFNIIAYLYIKSRRNSLIHFCFIFTELPLRCIDLCYF